MVVPVRSSMTSDGRAVETEKIRASTEGTSIFTCFSSSSEVVDLNEGMRSSLEGAAFASAKKAAIPASSSDKPPASRPPLGKPSALMLSAAIPASSSIVSPTGVAKATRALCDSTCDSH